MAYKCNECDGTSEEKKSCCGTEMEEETEETTEGEKKGEVEEEKFEEEM